MKNLLIIFTFVFTIVFSSTSFSEWTAVSKDSGGVTYYVDFERIRKHDGYVYFWTLQDLLKPTEYGHLSYKMYQQGDCKHFRYKVLSMKFHEEPMGRGPVADSHNPKGEDWEYPSPDSVIEGILQSVCSR